MQEQYCPEVHYRVENGYAVVTGCYGTDGELSLPDKIMDYTIAGIAPYAFAKSSESDELVWKSSDIFVFDNIRRICEEDITQIRLPFYVEDIGRYAFYRCRNLRKLILSDRLLEIGGGAFTGCRLQEVEIHFYDGERSCLKSILDEIRFKIRVWLHFHSQDGTVEKASLLFPEHYEEAVENTPARMLETRHHGSGGDYRQCFYERRLDFQKYDELLWRAKAQEEIKTVIELCFSRLLYPYKLSDNFQKEYEEYVKENIEEAGKYAAVNERIAQIRYLTDRGMWSEKALEKAIEQASVSDKTGCVGLLMDIKRQLFPKKMKIFDL